MLEVSSVPSLLLVGFVGKTVLDAGTLSEDVDCSSAASASLSRAV